MSLQRASLSNYCTQIAQDVQRIREESQKPEFDKIGPPLLEEVHVRSRELLRLASHQDRAKLASCHMVLSVYQMKQAFLRQEDLSPCMEKVAELSQWILHLDANLQTPLSPKATAKEEPINKPERVYVVLEDTNEVFKDLILDELRRVGRRLRNFLLPAVANKLPVALPNDSASILALHGELHRDLSIIIPRFNQIQEAVLKVCKEDELVGSARVLQAEALIQVLEDAGLSGLGNHIINDIQRIQSSLQELDSDFGEQSPFEGVYAQSRDLLRLSLHLGRSQHEAAQLALAVLKMKGAASKREDLAPFVEEIAVLNQRIQYSELNPHTLLSPRFSQNEERKENAMLKQEIEKFSPEYLEKFFEELILDEQAIIARKLLPFLGSTAANSLKDLPFLPKILKAEKNLDPRIVEVIPQFVSVKHHIESLRKGKLSGFEKVIAAESMILSLEQAKEKAIPSFLYAILTLVAPHSLKTCKTLKDGENKIEEVLREKPDVFFLVWQEFRKRIDEGVDRSQNLSAIIDNFLHLDRLLRESAEKEAEEEEETGDEIVDTLKTYSSDGQVQLIQLMKDHLWSLERYKVLLEKNFQPPTLLAIFEKAILNGDEKAQLLFVEEEILKKIHTENEKKLKELMDKAHRNVKKLYEKRVGRLKK